MGGMPDGSFNPDGNVTRAEMAKMIYAVRMRGNTDAGNFAGLSTSFTDLYDDWYKGYVKWAQSAGIIAGKSANTFDPDGSVTGTEAAKMLLVLAGYTSDKAGLTGINWETNTIKYASQAGLLDNMDNVDLSKALPRQYAAQLIYNALFTPMVKWSNDSETFEEQTNKDQQGDGGYNTITTIGLQYMDLRFFEGTFDGNYQTGAAGKDGYVKFTATANASGYSGGTVQVEYDLDLNWIGEEVTVLYQDNNLKGNTTVLDNDDTIYGVTKTGDTTVYNTTKGDLKTLATADGKDETSTDNTKIKFGGVEYEVADTVKVVKNYGAKTGATYTTKTSGGSETGTAAYQLEKALKAKSADTIKFICNDNGDIATAYVMEKDVNDITSLTSSKIGIRVLGTKDIEDDNVVLYDGAKVGDLVYYYSQYATGRGQEIVVEKATTVTGKIEYLTETNTVASVNGTEYTIGADAHTIGDYDMVTNVQAFEDEDVGSDVELVLYGKYIIAAQALTENYSDYAMVVGSEYSPVGGTTVKLLLADNTTKVLNVHEKSLFIPNGKQNDNGDSPVIDAVITDETAAILVSYSITDDGVKMKKVMDTAGTADGDTKYAKDTKTLTITDGTDYIVKSDAAIFLYNSTKKEWKSYSLSALGDITITSGKSIMYKLNSSNYVTALAATTADVSGSSTGNDLVGYVLDDGKVLGDGTDNYKEYQVWDGAENKAVRIDIAGSTKMKKGQFIKIKDFSETEEYVDSEITVLNTTIKVKEYNPEAGIIVDTTDAIAADGTVTKGADTAYPLASSVKIIGVNTDDVAGEATDTVSTYVKSYQNDKDNALIVLDSENKVAYIFVDNTNGEIVIPA